MPRKFMDKHFFFKLYPPDFNQKKSQLKTYIFSFLILETKKNLRPESSHTFSNANKLYKKKVFYHCNRLISTIEFSKQKIRYPLLILAEKKTILNVYETWRQKKTIVLNDFALPDKATWTTVCLYFFSFSLQSHIHFLSGVFLSSDSHIQYTWKC